MVFSSLVAFARTKGPDEFWRKRKVFKLAAHFRGRPRNCYSLTIRNVLRSLAKATKGRVLKREDLNELWVTRITAGVEEHGMGGFKIFKDGLNRANVFLNHKILANLAIWEPRSFKAITHVSWTKAKEDNARGSESLGPPPSNVDIRNLKDS